MKIGIIGAGHIGGTLTRKLTHLGHNVLIANSHGPESLAALASETGAKAVTPKDAVKGVDLVVITIPEKNIPELPKDLFQGVPDSVIVVDTGNYYAESRDGVIADLEEAPTESTWVSHKIGRPVVKAFNTILAYSLANGGKPRGATDRIALPVAGDDSKTKKVLMDLIDQLGFDAVDGGRLDESWRQQPGTPGYCTNLNASELKKALADANRTRAAKMHKLFQEKMTHLTSNSSPDELVKIARELQKAA